jgi:hypothetical protein
VDRFRSASEHEGMEVAAERVAAAAIRRYGDRVGPLLLDQWARAAVADLWADGPRVAGFVQSLALRAVAERVAVHDAECEFRGAPGDLTTR